MKEVKIEETENGYLVTINQSSRYVYSGIDFFAMMEAIGKIFWTKKIEVKER